MIILQRPGRNPLEIEFILLNFEGTLATDRRIHPKAKDKLNLLSKRTNIFILTRGNKEVVSEVLKKVNAEVIYFKEAEASEKKLELFDGSGEPERLPSGMDSTMC